MELATLTIAERFHGPKHSGNGGYVCGRLAEFVPGTTRVRLYVPPPLDRPMVVVRRPDSVVLELDGRSIAEAWPASLDLDLPDAPSIGEARTASKRFRGFGSHRFSTCFVCGPDREPDDGLHIFAGPLDDRPMLACCWRPRPDLMRGDGSVGPEFIWCVLDCPGGFAFPEPDQGTILLGQLTVEQYAPVGVGQDCIITAWELSREGRKHHTGTALYSGDGRPLAAGRGIWFEVEDGVAD